MFEYFQMVVVVYERISEVFNIDIQCQFIYSCLGLLLYASIDNPKTKSIFRWFADAF